MAASSIAYLFAFINLLNVVAYLSLLVVAICFWRRYPRPSLYLGIMASLELFGSVLQPALQVVLTAGGISEVMLAQAFVSLLRLVAHAVALCFLVLAVYVARRPGPFPTTTAPLASGTPGMENGDQAFLLDPTNPYSPPRQPR